MKAKTDLSNRLSKILWYFLDPNKIEDLKKEFPKILDLICSLDNEDNIIVEVNTNIKLYITFTTTEDRYLNSISIFRLYTRPNKSYSIKLYAKSFKYVKNYYYNVDEMYEFFHNVILDSPSGDIDNIIW